MELFVRVVLLLHSVDFALARFMVNFVKDSLGLAEETFKVDNILQFLDDNKFPLVTQLTEINSARVYSSSNKIQVTAFPLLSSFLFPPSMCVAVTFS